MSQWSGNVFQLLLWEPPVAPPRTFVRERGLPGARIAAFSGHPAVAAKRPQSHLSERRPARVMTLQRSETLQGRKNAPEREGSPPPIPSRSSFPWQPPAPSPSKLRAVPDRKNVSDGGTPPWQPPRPDEKSKKGREANLKTVPLLMWYAGFLSRQPDTPSCHADPVASGAFCDKERQNGIKSRRDP